MKKVLLFLTLISIFSPLLSQITEDEFNKAANYQKQQKFAKAIKGYTKVLKKDSSLWYASANRGLCYTFLDQHEAGIHDFLRALKTTTEKGSIQILLGNTYAVLKQHRLGITYFQKALSHDEKFSHIDYFNLGSSYYFLNILDSAKLYLEISYNMDPENSSAVDNLAWVYLNDNPEKSCKYFNEAYLKDTLDARRINNLGYSYLLCGNLKKSFELFVKAEKLDKSNSFIYRNFGLYYMKKDNKKLACENLNKAIELNIIEEWGEHYIIELREFCKNK